MMFGKCETEVFSENYERGIKERHAEKGKKGMQISTVTPEITCLKILKRNSILPLMLVFFLSSSLVVSSAYSAPAPAAHKEESAKSNKPLSVRELGNEIQA